MREHASRTQRPMVAIVGRPNVGKSTLFNRLIQRRVAITQNTPGITRDRIHADAEWQGNYFTLIDTGGLMPGLEDGFTAAIDRQVMAALAEADAIVLVVDGRQGVNPVDVELAQTIRRLGKPVLLAVNKIDHPSIHGLVHEFHRLGIGEPWPVSAEHGTGTGDLLDAVVGVLPEAPAEDFPADSESQDPISDDLCRVAVLGRPNVGKSSLVNSLLGNERVIVSDLPGTTRDAVDVYWESSEGRFILVDTAGMRRRSRVSDSVEFYSSTRALSALRRADVGLLVIEATGPVNEQDKRLADAIDESGRAAVVVVNKWDLVESSDEAADEFRRRLYLDMPFLSYAPIIFTSALTGRSVTQLPGLIRKVAERHKAEIGTGALNRAVADAVERNQPPSVKGKRLRIRYATQVNRQPPTFLLFVNDASLVTATWRRYLERRLRERFDFSGTPIRLVLRRGSAS
ncbi:MAG: ribosome biogenesis GTPase Der [Thermaerobacterales bacterium]